MLTFLIFVLCIMLRHVQKFKSCHIAFSLLARGRLAALQAVLNVFVVYLLKVVGWAVPDYSSFSIACYSIQSAVLGWLGFNGAFATD